MFLFLPSSVEARRNTHSDDAPRTAHHRGWEELAGLAVSRLPVPGGGPVAMNRRSGMRVPCTVAMRISINECIHVGSAPYSVIQVRTTRIRVLPRR
jgi:hypothetical protein